MKTPFLKLFKFDFLHDLISHIIVFGVDHDAPVFGRVKHFVHLRVEVLEFLVLKSLELLLFGLGKCFDLTHI